MTLGDSSTLAQQFKTPAAVRADAEETVASGLSASLAQKMLSKYDAGATFSG